MYIDLCFNYISLAALHARAREIIGVYTPPPENTYTRVHGILRVTQGGMDKNINIRVYCTDNYIYACEHRELSYTRARARILKINECIMYAENRHARLCHTPFSAACAMRSGLSVPKRSRRCDEGKSERER